MTVRIVSAPTGSGKTSLAAGVPFASGASSDPGDFQLPHETWRKHQRETLLWIADGAPRRVVSLVKTKNLQSSQYDKEYGFDAHYGRANYLCAHPGAESGTTCAECMFLEEGGMHVCPVSADCPYLLSKSRAIQSQKASLNYAYWMTATNWRMNFPPEVLFCDEAHNLSEIVLNWSGVTVRAWDQRTWGLPRFPEIDSTARGSVLRKTDPPEELAIQWLLEADRVMKNRYQSLKNGSDQDKARKAYSLSMKISNVLESIQRCGRDWYIRSGGRARRYRGTPEPAFICRPLTARHHAGRYFVSDKFDTVMMSATIGNPATFAEELGIAEYDYRAIPNQWPPECRPIHVLDVPRLSHKSPLEAYEDQADAIYRAIMGANKRWSGFIHVTRKQEARLLAMRLAERGLYERVWVTPGAEYGTYVPTDQQILAWEERKLKVPNSICISWSMWEGIDGRDEKIDIVAKVPFAAIGDPYEKARLRYSNRMYLQRAAWQLEQGLGRTRRGREEDYDVYGEVRGFVAIADGNWTRVKKYLSEDVREAIVE